MSGNNDSGDDNGIVAEMDGGQTVTVSDDGMVTVTASDGTLATIDTTDSTVTIDNGGTLEYYENGNLVSSDDYSGSDGGGDDGGGWDCGSF
jgi:antitoxin component YwqK of YwqJK toxin-antitoxin module